MLQRNLWQAGENSRFKRVFILFYMTNHQKQPFVGWMMPLFGGCKAHCQDTSREQFFLTVTTPVEGSGWKMLLIILLLSHLNDPGILVCCFVSLFFFFFFKQWLNCLDDSELPVWNKYLPNTCHMEGSVINVRGKNEETDQYFSNMY